MLGVTRYVDSHNRDILMLTGLSLEQATKFAKTMGFSQQCIPSAADTIMKLYQIFIEKDALLIEINPMAEDSLGRGKATR